MKYLIIIACIGICSFIGCVNPFAPAIIENDAESLAGDQTTVEGFFKNFRYAYQFKDTLVYGKLLADDYTFIFRDYNLGIDKTWGREEDMLSTWRMFQGVNSCDLIWNEAVKAVGDSLLLDITRSFNLSIEVNPGDVLKVYGRAYIRIKRNSENEEWKMQKWVDESNY